MHSWYFIVCSIICSVVFCLPHELFIALFDKDTHTYTPYTHVVNVKSKTPAASSILQWTKIKNPSSMVHIHLIHPAIQPTWKSREAQSPILRVLFLYQAFWCNLTIKGNWLPASFSLFNLGRCTTVDLAITSSAGTANSNSKFRTRMNNSAFILRELSELIISVDI